MASYKDEIITFQLFNPPSRKASADALGRFNSQVFAMYFVPKACTGIHTI